MNPFIGMIAHFGFNFAPRDWGFCSGATLAINQNTTLFSLLGTTYGGDGRTTFALPDLRGRAPIHMGRHTGSQFDWRIGQIAGAETITLDVNQLAQHSHTASFTPSGGGGGGGGVTVTVSAATDSATTGTPAAGDYLAKVKETAPGNVFTYFSGTPTSTVALGGVAASGGGVGGGGGSVTVNNTGNSQAFSNLQPVLVVNFCIAMQGLYPSRS